MDTLTQIRTTFAGKAKDGFEYAISEVATLMNGAARDAANFQLMFDLLYWDYTASYPNIDPLELDRIALKYSRFGESQEMEIGAQIKAAEEWSLALEENGLDPSEALGLSKSELEMIVDKEQRSSSLVESSSHIAVPLEICRLMRNFYRAQRTAPKYSLTATNVLKPLYLAKEVICKSQATNEELKELIIGRVFAFMRQVKANTAKGRWVIPKAELEIGAITEFADFLVFNLLNKKWHGNKSMFSQQAGIGLIEDAVFYLYILEEDKEKQ